MQSPHSKSHAGFAHYGPDVVVLGATVVVDEAGNDVVVLTRPIVVDGVLVPAVAAAAAAVAAPLEGLDFFTCVVTVMVFWTTMLWTTTFSAGPRESSA